MSLHQKVAGAWVQCQRPYVKVNGVWTACTAAYVKRSGAWVQAYEYDVTPPNPPELSLQLVEDWTGSELTSRWIRVGVRLPGSANDPDARLVRVLTAYEGKPPTTQFGGTYTPTPDSTYPSEPWSEWRYNSYGSHADTSAYVYKQWTLNPSSGTIIPGDRDYYFTGWSLDANGNWSASTPAVIHVPKATVKAETVVVKEARIQPNTSGSWRSSQGYATGDLVQQYSPKSRGLWFYGNQFTDSFGAVANTTVRSAQINIRRLDDIGQANANVYLFWNSYGSPGALPAAGQTMERNEVTKLGTLAKGQAKWFELPAPFLNNFNNSIKCIGLDYQDPAKASAFPEDYSAMASTAAKLRCGEVHIVWEEQL